MSTSTQVPLMAHPAEPATAEPADSIKAESLKRSFVSGLLWTGGIKWTTQLVSWPLMLVIARLLTPADFGFVALVTVWTRLLMLLTEGGLGSAIVLGPVCSPQVLRQLNALALGSAALAFAVGSLAAHPLALFYKNPELRWVMIAISATILVEGMMLVPVARMRRSMRFRRLAAADALRALVDAGLTLTLAWLGARYWSLVVGYGAGVLATGVVAVFSAPTAFQRPEWAVIKGTLGRARQILTSSLASFAYSSADMVIVGRLLGPAAAGAYSFAGVIASAPRDKLIATLSRVTPSVFGALQADLARLRLYVEGLTRILALTMFPIMGGIALTAPALVSLLLGSQWDAAVLPLQLLCVSTGFTAINVAVPQVLHATGNGKTVAQNSLLALLAFVPGFYILGKIAGIAGLAAVWAILTPLFNARLVYTMCRAIELKPTAYVKLVLPALGATIGMIVAVIMLRSLLDLDHSSALSIMVDTAAGSVTYLTLLLAFDRKSIASVVQVIAARFAEIRSSRLTVA